MLVDNGWGGTGDPPGQEPAKLGTALRSETSLTPEPQFSNGAVRLEVRRVLKALPALLCPWSQGQPAGCSSHPNGLLSLLAHTLPGLVWGLGPLLQEAGHGPHHLASSSPVPKANAPKLAKAGRFGINAQAHQKKRATGLTVLAASSEPVPGPSERGRGPHTLRATKPSSKGSSLSHTPAGQQGGWGWRGGVWGGGLWSQLDP